MYKKEELSEILKGEESEVIENFIKLFNNFYPDLKQFLRDVNEQLIKNSIIIIKRVKKNNASLKDLRDLIFKEANGIKILNEFANLYISEIEQKEYVDCLNYFLEIYKKDSIFFETCVSFRDFLDKVLEDILE